MSSVIIAALVLLGISDPEAGGTLVLLLGCGYAVSWLSPAARWLGK